MRSYELRQSIRCPKKYGETTKERKFMLPPAFNLDLMLEQRDPQTSLDERYIRNAAALPELADLPRGSSDGVGGEEKSSGDALMIHGYTVADYQQTYHSVVDPVLCRPCGKLAPYSLELGFTIKEQLFEELAYPTLQVSEHADGRVEVTERFCVLRPTPFIDCKGEQW